MPSPFPGMDPYLEQPAYWRGFHNSLVAFIEGALNAVLPPGFSANAEERVYLVPLGRAAVPDVHVHEMRMAYADASRTGTPGIQSPEPHGTVTVYPEEASEFYVSIRRSDRREEVVAIIEVLSPANKARGNPGRDEYLRKQRDVLASGTHLMEIDLLREGEYTVAAPEYLLRERGSWDYLVCLHRATTRNAYDYWFASLRSVLPRVKVPLTPDVPDVVLDLQECFTRAYDNGPYARDISYCEEPPAALSPGDVVWADELLRTKGLRGEQASATSGSPGTPPEP